MIYICIKHQGVSTQTSGSLLSYLLLLRLETPEQKKERIKERALKLQADRDEESQKFLQNMYVGGIYYKDLE